MNKLYELYEALLEKGFNKTGATKLCKAYEKKKKGTILSTQAVGGQAKG